MAKTGTLQRGPDLVRLREIRERLGISERAAREWVKQGIFPIPLLHINGRWYAKRADVEAFFSGCQVMTARRPKQNGTEAETWALEYLGQSSPASTA